MENQFYVLGNYWEAPCPGTAVHDLKVNGYDVSYQQVSSRDEDEDCPPLFVVQFSSSTGQYEYQSRKYEKIHFSKFCKTMRWMVSAGCPYIPLEAIYQFCQGREEIHTEDLEMFAIKIFENFTTVKTVEGENDEPSIS